MKNGIVYPFILLFSLFFACSNDKNNDIPKGDPDRILKVSLSELSFLAVDDSKLFYIESNTSWLIQEIPD